MLLLAYSSLHVRGSLKINETRFKLVNVNGINVNGISPGVVDTPMWDHVDSLFAKYENLAPGEKRRQVG